ncbi:MAG: hypothetical protein COU25_01995, partial [Candidatus Levybacteria bacterium CG10_big_fil_rev_8_21_14_0_10_35_13]
YTPSFVVGSWVGNNDNTPMGNIASGVSGAAPIWNRLMRLVLKDKQDEPPKVPGNVVALTVDAYGGGIPYDNRPIRSEYFIKGTEPTSPSQVYQKLRLSKHDSGKLASPWEVEHGSYDTKDYIVLKENDQISIDGKNRWQEGINEWIKTTYAADRPEYYPPTETSDYKEDENNNPTLTPIPSATLTPTQTPTPTL